MVDEADVVNEAVARVPSRKRRDSRSPPQSPKDRRRKGGELSPNLGKRINPPTPPLPTQENVNQSLPPIPQPVVHLQPPPGITSEKPSIDNVHLNQNVKITNPVSVKKRKLPETEGWNEQRKLSKQSVNPQLRKLQQLHHNKIHGQGSSAFTAPLNMGKDKVESSKEISSILRNACMLPNAAKATKTGIKTEKTMTNHGFNNQDASNKGNRYDSFRKALLKNKAVRRVYEENAKIRLAISQEIRRPGGGKYSWLMTASLSQNILLLVTVENIS